jgi:hypothetical protein
LEQNDGKLGKTAFMRKRMQPMQQILETKDRRILSVFNHQPICSHCKKEEEKRPDYEDASRQMMAECIAEASKPYGDPANYCFHHFCPFKCS